MNTANLAAIVAVALFYLVLSLLALAYEYFYRPSEDRRILAIFYSYAAFGTFVLILTVLLIMFSLNNISYEDITPVYIISFAFISLILCVRSIFYAGVKETSKLSYALNSGRFSNSILYILRRVSLFCVLLFFYKGTYDLITTMFISANKGLIALGIILVEMLLCVVCFIVLLKIALKYRTRKTDRQ